METPGVERPDTTTKIKAMISRFFESLNLDRTAQLQALNSLRCLVLGAGIHTNDRSDLAIEILRNILDILKEDKLTDRASMLILGIINSKIREINESSSRSKHRMIAGVLSNHEA